MNIFKLTTKTITQSRMWVSVRLLGLIWIADMRSWNHIQLVSCSKSPCLYADLVPWNPIQSVSLYASPELDFEFDMKSHPGGESLCVPGLDSNCWHLTCEISSRGWVVVRSWAWFELLTSDMKSHPEGESLCAPGLDSNCWHVVMKSYPACELPPPSLHLNGWYATMNSHPGSELFLASIWVTDFRPW